MRTQYLVDDHGIYWVRFGRHLSKPRVVHRGREYVRTGSAEDVGVSMYVDCDRYEEYRGLVREGRYCGNLRTTHGRIDLR